MASRPPVLHRINWIHFTLCCATLLGFASVTSASGDDSARRVDPFVNDPQPALANFDVTISLSWADYDGDSDPDLYLVFEGPNRLLRNDAGTFVDVTSGPEGDAGLGRGSTWGDYDNDGDPDLFVTNEGGVSRLLRNDAGTFVDVTVGELVWSNPTTPAWVDMDLDGDLDLFIARAGGARKVRNDGGGTFTDIGFFDINDTEGGAWGDYDNDGDMDVYIATSGNHVNKLFRNDGGGNFTDVSTPTLWQGLNALAAAWGDYDNDGLLDLYMANSGDDHLFHNDGGGVFTDVTGIGPAAWASGVTSNVNWVDFDNDGFLDLVLVNDGVALYRNVGGASFVATSLGALSAPLSSRMAAVADFDGDGFLDLAVPVPFADTLLWLNTGNSNHWLEVDVVGLPSNTSAIGAQVELTAGGVTQRRQIESTTGGLSQSWLTASFGLGAATTVDQLQVTWPGGSRNRIETSLPVDQRVVLTAPPARIHVDADAVGAGDGTSWADAYVDLQAALSAAISGDEVWVAEGIYKPTSVVDRDATFALTSGVAIYGGFSGSEVSLFARNPSLHPTILSGDIGGPDGSIYDTGDNSRHVVSALNCDASAVLDGFVIQNGRGDVNPGGGGGILVDGGSPTFANLEVTANIAYRGGGIYVMGNATPTFTGVDVHGNSVNQSGAGMYVEPGSLPVFHQSAFRDGFASLYGGGVSGGGSYHDVQFLSNTADEGGAGVAGSGTFEDVLFEDNYAIGTGGGMQGSGTFTNVVFRSNTAVGTFEQGGGGLHGGGTLVNVTFEGNTSPGGGGGMWDQNGASQLINVVFLQNSSSHGGGYYIGPFLPIGPMIPAAPSEMYNVTFVANSAGFGGNGCYSYLSELSLFNSILWSEGQGSSPTQVVNNGGTITFSRSLVEGSGGSAAWNPLFGVDAGGNLDVDPLLRDVLGGDVRVGFGSPVIDAGDTGVLPPGVAADRDGGPRVIGAAVDMGAYELGIPILGIQDVPNDQGRQVRLTWGRIFDDAQNVGSDMTRYDVFRRVDDLPKNPPEPSSKTNPGSWDFLGSVPASGADEYNLVTATLCDSTEAGTCWSVFFLRAVTTDPYVFFDSAPDSGYSIDNLAPNVPQGLIVAYGGGADLVWQENEDADLRYYKVYRGDSPNFAIDPSKLVHTTTSTAWHDAQGGFASHYRVAAVDFAGNESEAANPEQLTGVDEPATHRFALEQNNPNPFNPMTVISYSLPDPRWAELTIYDVAGRMVRQLVARQETAGRHTVRWDGTDDAGRKVASGVYLYRLRAGDLQKTQRMTLVR